MSRTATTPTTNPPAEKTRLDRALSVFTDVHPGEGATAVLMLANIFLLLICYSVIKTVREPLILLGGGAEVRSYAAGGQALLLMGFVPLYSWFASRVPRASLLVGVTLFFIVCIEVFAAAVAVRTPYIGVAFFIWVGIFNISLVSQFWSFANDIYTKNAGDRLFPVLAIGMTAGAPLGSIVASRLFRMGVTPQVILQISALLLSVSACLYYRLSTHDLSGSRAARAPMSAEGGFRLVMTSRYLRLIALLVVLLNLVNTTGEYVIAKRLVMHVAELALGHPGFNKQAYIGAFSGEYQFWVNIAAFLLQALVTSRLIKYRGLRGALLALPLIALGGYAVIAAGVGFSVVQWVKTAENATDYSIMNTARQLLWLPTNREEKYKAKQAIDTFFVRSGDVLSAGLVYMGTHMLHLTISQFAISNIVLTLVWLGVALLILKPFRTVTRVARRSFVPRTVTATIIILAVSLPAMAQGTREEQLAAERAAKAKTLHPYTPDALERRLETVDRVLSNKRPLSLFMGSIYDGAGMAFGPAYRTRFGDSGAFNAHAAWSVANARELDAVLTLPSLNRGRLKGELRSNWLDAPSLALFEAGNDSTKAGRSTFSYRAASIGAAARLTLVKRVSVGTSFDAIGIDAAPASPSDTMTAADPHYAKTAVFAEFDSRTSPDYSRGGSLYRVSWSDYRQTNAGAHSFRRTDAEVQQYVPLLRENWVLAFRALASTTDTAAGQDVPAFLMPNIGGTHGLRGFADRRFRDRNRVLLTGEYRWTAGPFVDMALFVDAGKVAARRADLNFKNLTTSHGIGVSFHTPNTTVTRIELSRSREGTSLRFSFSPCF